MKQQPQNQQKSRHFLQGEVAEDVQMVKKEIRRLQHQAQEKNFHRFQYRCLRHGKGQGFKNNDKEVRSLLERAHAPLACAETMIFAAKRRLESADTRLVAASDLRFVKEKDEPPLEVCLLIDTSGSMSGKRMTEVKLLADYLVSHMHEPLSLVTFQENDVGVKVTSTRQGQVVREGLRSLNAAGLTPMGEGIRHALSYVKKRRGKKHLLILITDGLPTWAKGSKDPYLDAIEAGAELRKHHIQLICIGLEPQRQFLERLADAAGASLYIVCDLDHREIAEITRREKSRAVIAE